MQVLAAFRWSGAVPWPVSSVYRIFSEIEMDAAPDWRGFPGKSSSWALSRHHPAFLSLSTSLARFLPVYRSLMDKKDNIRYVSLLFSAFRGLIVAIPAPPISALGELRLPGRRNAPV